MVFVCISTSTLGEMAARLNEYFTVSINPKLLCEPVKVGDFYQALVCSS